MTARNEKNRDGSICPLKDDEYCDDNCAFYDFEEEECAILVISKHIAIIASVKEQELDGGK